jgi:macrolide phosphotransferase
MIKVMIKEPQEVLELSRRCGLSIQEDSLKFNESGLDFQVVLATDAEGERWVLRFPRREDVLPSIDKEKRTLDLVAPLLTVESPRWIISTDELIAYRALNGRPAVTIDSEAKAHIWEIDPANIPEQFHESLAEGMVSLHQISLEKARAADLPIETIEEARSAMKQRMDAVKDEFGVGQALWNRWQQWLYSDVLWSGETVLTHGDLHAGHILIDAQAKVTGLIDWTEASVTDPAIDFLGHYQVFGEQALKKLIAAYARSGGYVWTKMAEHIVERLAAYPVAIAEFALRSGLDEYKQMARQSLCVIDLE